MHLPKLSHKQWMYVIGGMAVLGLLYWYYQRQSSAASTASTTPASTGDTLGTTDTGGYGSGDYGGGGFGSGSTTTSPDYSSELATDEGNISALQAGAGVDPATGQPYSSEISSLTASLPSLIAAAIPAPVPGASGAAGVSGHLTKAQNNELTSIAATQKKQSATLKAITKKLTTHTAVKHTKTPPKTSNGSAHTNANHPTGTAKHAVAPVSHAPKVAPKSFKPVQVPKPKPPAPKKTRKPVAKKK